MLEGGSAFPVPRAGRDSAGRHRDTPAHPSPRTRDGGFHGLSPSPRACHFRSGDPASVKNKTHPKPGLGGLCLLPPRFLERRESRGGEALLALRLRYIYYRAGGSRQDFLGRQFSKLAEEGVVGEPGLVPA